MTWKELEAWAKRNGMGVGAYLLRGRGDAWICAQETADYMSVEGKTVGDAKRALCRAVERIREAT